jgi:hypothetical protein
MFIEHTCIVVDVFSSELYFVREVQSPQLLKQVFNEVGLVNREVYGFRSGHIFQIVEEMEHGG